MDLYDDKIDIWSLGCIFAEMAYMWNQKGRDASNRYLFQGNSCFPLSPNKNDKVKEDKEEDITISEND